MPPKGFLYSSAHAGIKKKNDLGLILCLASRPVSAGVFTENKFAAACVTHSRELLAKGNIKALLINSGIANACTGQEGMRRLLTIIEKLSSLLKIPADNTAMTSTGVIGKQLPVQKIKSALPSLIENLKEDYKDFSEAILTTDTKVKISEKKFKLNNKTVTITGICKGSGMIHPNMATMLCFITTDVNIKKGILRKLLKKAASATFNNLSVDGDTSTNDSVYIISSKEAGNPSICAAEQKECGIFFNYLKKVCAELSEKIALDGEGATKLIKIKVTKAKTEKDAENIAATVGTSLLVKTAVFGEDANWGRIVAAAGRSGAFINPEKLLLKINGKILFKNGQGINSDKSKMRNLLKPKKVDIELILNTGTAQTEYLTCDLSYDYVRINAEYHT